MLRKSFMLEKVKIDSNFELFTTADHRSSVISSVQTKIFKENSNFPADYSFENTKMHQLWWSSDNVDFEALGQQLGMRVKTVSTILLPPGSVIPLHCDTFHKLKTEYPEEEGLMVRAVIYATAYEMGQFTQYRSNKEITVFTNWSVGDGHLWDDQIPHVTANASYKDLITINISGFR